MQTLVDEVASYNDALAMRGNPIPAFFWSIPMADRLVESNGIGSDDPSVQWAMGPLNAFLPWMEFASVPHDELWSVRWNDGSESRFHQSNAIFRDLLLAKADGSYSWLPSRFLREWRRDAMRFEANVAHGVLEMAFSIWVKNAAQPDEGPERMA